jgi:hypothetical protein
VRNRGCRVLRPLQPGGTNAASNRITHFATRRRSTHPMPPNGERWTTLPSACAGTCRLLWIAKSAWRHARRRQECNQRVRWRASSQSRTCWTTMIPPLCRHSRPEHRHTRLCQRTGITSITATPGRLPVQVVIWPMSRSKATTTMGGLCKQQSHLRPPPRDRYYRRVSPSSRQKRIMPPKRSHNQQDHH